MSSGFNQAILLGRLAAPPEELKSKSGKSYVRAVVAVTVYQKSSEGIGEERTSFIPVTIFGRQGEIFSKYVQKGDVVYLAGRLDSNEWLTSSGERRLSLGFVVEQVHLLPNERRPKVATETEGE
jgi:single-strand DNA-binding protein